MYNNSNYRQPTGSMVQPSSPYLSQAWQNQQQPKKPRRWILPVVFGLMVLVIVLIVIAVTTQQPIQPVEDQPHEEYGREVEDTATDATDLNAYFSQLVDDPDYQPEYISKEPVYYYPPINFSCDELEEVPKMNLKLLNIYLDYGYVVVLQGRGSAPFTRDGNRVLVYSGSFQDSRYQTINLVCPYSADAAINPVTFSGSDIFNNLTHDKQYYVWIDPTKNSREE